MDGLLKKQSSAMLYGVDRIRQAVRPLFSEFSVCSQSTRLQRIPGE